jgi:uncharacterized protein (DUF433 family)
MTPGERISIDPKVCHGKPCIRGTRIMVANILGQLEGGESWESIRAGYPELSDDDIRAAIAYAAAVVQDEEVILFDQVK